MLLRERVLDLARRLQGVNAFTDPHREETRELEAALDEAILAAGSLPAAIDVDQAILSLLESEPARRFPAEALAAEISHAVEAVVRRRLETLAHRGEIRSAGQGHYASRTRGAGLRSA